MQELEEWKDIDGCSGYKVSSSGRVIGPRGRIIKLQKYKDRGCYLFFRMPHKKFTQTIHRMVALAFIENMHNKPEVNHIDGDKNNNTVSNLEWCTRKENMVHAHSTGLKVNRGSRKIFDKIQYRVLLDCFEAGYTNVAISKYFKCHNSTIAYIRHGKRANYSI